MSTIFLVHKQSIFCGAFVPSMDETKLPQKMRWKIISSVFRFCLNSDGFSSGFMKAVKKGESNLADSPSPFGTFQPRFSPSRKISLPPPSVFSSFCFKGEYKTAAPGSFHSKRVEQSGSGGGDGEGIPLQVDRGISPTPNTPPHPTPSPPPCRPQNLPGACVLPPVSRLKSLCVTRCSTRHGVNTNTQNKLHHRPAGFSIYLIPICFHEFKASISHDQSTTICKFFVSQFFFFFFATPQ